MQADTSFWKRVTALFHDALALPAAERQAFLEETCADEAIRNEVLDLLSTAESVPTYLDQPAAVALNIVPQAATLDPKHIGPYKVIRPLGRGGMGSVYLAERENASFVQRVAVKVVNRGLPNHVMVRFRYERQILASLQHPHIAHLLDGGITEDGRPFLVMEYVDGVPITDYADSQHLSITERLDLFQTVCRAVQYAHQNLIVHRDLKPSNMLVMQDGVVKLLDFGISKLLDEEAQATLPITVPLTEADHPMMTPEYAAPEQVRGEPITTATDTYQLGILLFELLVGKRPFVVQGRSRHAVEQAILDQAPTRPSMAVTLTDPTHEAPEDTAALAKTRGGLTTEELRRQLKGDLDVIVLKALNKQPERRYGEVSALVEDIRRHRAGLPVMARPASMTYRVRKFVERNRVGVATGLVVLLSLIVGLAGTIWQARVASQEREKAEIVSAYLTQLFSASNPWEATTDSMTVRDVLDRGLAQLDTELRDNPLVRAEIMMVLGEVYVGLGSYTQADQLYQEALALQQTNGSSQSIEVAESLQKLAHLRKIQAAYPEADSLLSEALVRYQRTYGQSHFTIAQVHNNQGQVLQEQGRHTEAIPLFRDGLSMLDSTDLAHRKEWISLRQNLGAALHAERHLDEAERIYRTLLVELRALHGDVHPAIGLALNNLAGIVQDQGDWVEAEQLYRQTIAIDEATLGPEHTDVGIDLSNLAILLAGLDRFEEAEPLYRRAVTIFQKAFGPHHLHVFGDMMRHGLTLAELNRHLEAQAVLQEAQRVAEVAWGPNHRLRALAMLHETRSLHENDQHEAAFRTGETALSLVQPDLPPTHPRYAELQSYWGRILVEHGYHTRAETLLRKSYHTFAENDHSDQAQRSLAVLLAVYEATGDTAAHTRYAAFKTEH